MKKPRLWTVVVVLLAAVLGQLVGAFVVFMIAAGVVSREIGPRALQTPEGIKRIQQVFGSGGSLSFLSVLSACNLIGLALIAARLSPQPLPRRLRVGTAGLSTRAFVVAAAGGIALSSALSAATHLAGFEWKGMKAVALAISLSSPWVRASLVLTLGLMAGLSEELFFRGYVQSRFAARWGSTIGSVTAALAFGLYHLEPLYIVFAFAMGLYFGWLAERTGSVRPGVVAHVANNCTAVLTSGLLPDGYGGLLAFLIPAVIAVLAMLWLRRHLPAATVSARA